MDFRDWNSIAFSHAPSEHGFVYVFCYTSKDQKERPFYVGETGSFEGRMRDYMKKNFTATTDFKVGEAAKHMIEGRNCKVTVYYKEAHNRGQEELRIIRELECNGVTLLNRLEGYEYRTAAIDDERRRIIAFCDMHFV